MNSDVNDICDIPAEAGIIATLVLKPEMYFIDERLQPNHFTNKDNAYLFNAIRELAYKKVETLDAYDIYHLIEKNKIAKRTTEATISKESVVDLIANAPLIARRDPENYKVLTDSVISCALRRELYTVLENCQQRCFAPGNEELVGFEQEIYGSIDECVGNFASISDIKAMSEVIDEHWNDIKQRQQGSMAGSPLKFPILQDYVVLERGELICYAARAKEGKSMLMVNESVNQMRKGLSVLYIDTELSDRLFFCRLISHLSKVEFYKVKNGFYNEEESHRIDDALQWIKEHKLVHLYMPMITEEALYSVIRRTQNKFGKLDLLVIDYFKANGSDGTAYGNYNALGKLVDFVKAICGTQNLYGLSCCQLREDGRIADSAKIARNASTIITLEAKSPQEIDADGGIEFGNKKARVTYNRNGPQMSDDEYISLTFNGNLISYQESKQPVREMPY